MKNIILLIFLSFTSLFAAEKPLTNEEAKGIIKFINLGVHYDETFKASPAFKQTLKKATATLKKDYPRLIALLPEKLKLAPVKAQNNSYLDLIEYLEKNPLNKDFMSTIVRNTQFSELSRVQFMSLKGYHLLKKQLHQAQPQYDKVYAFTQKPNFKYHLKTGIFISTPRTLAKFYSAQIQIALIEKDFDRAISILKKAISMSQSFNQCEGTIIHGLVSIAVIDIINQNIHDIVWEKDIELKHLRQIVELCPKLEYRTAYVKNHLKHEIHFLLSNLSSMVTDDKQIFMIQTFEEDWQKAHNSSDKDVKKKLDMINKGFDKFTFFNQVVKYYIAALRDCDQKSYDKMTAAKRFSQQRLTNADKNSYSYELFRGAVGWLAPSILSKAQNLINRQRAIYLSAALRLYEADTGALPSNLHELIISQIVPSIPKDAISGGRLKYDKKNRTIIAINDIRAKGKNTIVIQLKTTTSTVPKRSRAKARHKQDDFDDPFADESDTIDREDAQPNTSTSEDDPFSND